MAKNRKGNKKNSLKKKSTTPKVEKVIEKVEEAPIENIPMEEKLTGPGNHVPVEEVTPVEETVSEDQGPDQEPDAATDSVDAPEEEVQTPKPEATEPEPEPQADVPVAPPIEDTPVAPAPEEPVAKTPPAKKEEGDYKTRLYDEAVELRDRMVKLKTALETNAVPASEVEILTKQYGVMHELAVILNTRLGRLQVTG